MPPQDEAVSLPGTPPEGPHPERIPAEVSQHTPLWVTSGSGDESCFATSPSSSSDCISVKILLMPITAEAVQLYHPQKVFFTLKNTSSAPQPHKNHAYG